MNAKLFYRICGVLLGAALCIQAPAAMAGIVTTDNMAVQNQTTAEKSKVKTFIDRADVKDRLQALGVDESQINDRVAAMTDQEVHAVAQKIDSMPAGGRVNSGNLTLILFIIILILIF